MPGPSVDVAHTAQLDAATLQSIRRLLDNAFGADMSDDAFDHVLGGMHALVWEAGELAAHGAVVQRQLFLDGRPLRSGYVEGVAVRGDRRGRGYAALVMDALERIIRAAYDLGALGASELGAGLYRHRGWSQWQGPTWALAPSGLIRTEGEDADVHVLEIGPPLDVTGDLAAPWREGYIW
jgi:aminoglycoside 2'-N-acetyltransferase I